ncbi:MAG: AbrB/MazE/SpoVT family DNA-binding domain-containing protein [Clostridia bacterium]|nr:AbrB/MazE/SpoVT family DNA-binding domain-containing protein [Clostridia bacterium]
MKATGIVRRIDDLGRVVIPKEIRRTMRIREGDPLEIYTDRDGEVIFKKYSPIGELTSFATQYAETLHKTGGLTVAVTDRDAVIAVSGLPKKEYLEKKLTPEIERVMEGRSLYSYSSGEDRIALIDEGMPGFVRVAMPIVSDGDVVGCVCSLSGGDERKENFGEDVETKLIATAAAFLGHQIGD